MAKKVVNQIKLQIPAGRPIRLPRSGQHWVLPV